MITYNIDLGSAQEVKALIIGDHNISSAATVTLLGVDDPAYSTALSWSSSIMVHYLSTAQTKRYWQLQITDAANSDGYIEIGELFLGSYMELSRNIKEGYSEDTELLMETNETPYGIRRDRYYNTRKTVSIDFVAMSTSDVASMKSLVQTVTSRTDGTYKPFWFNLDSDSPEDSYLVKLDDLPVQHKTAGYYDISLDLQEIVKSV